MRLTLDTNRQSLRRYGHIKPARGGQQHCAQLCPGTDRRCGRERGHHGPHVSFGLIRKVVAVWEGSAAAVRPASAPAPKASRRPPRRRPARERGVLRTLRDFLAAPFASLEELAWAVFFIVFVGFAVGGLLLIYLG